MNAPTPEELADEKTRDELYERAKALDIEGRSDMDKEELAEAVAAAEGDGAGDASPAAAPGSFPGRPEQTATSNKTAGPPSPADQPGVGRPANPEPDPRLGPLPNLGVERVGREVERARERARVAREQAAQGDAS